MRIVLEMTKLLVLVFENCRGQNSNNAASKSGKSSGLQARLENGSRTALYISCFIHSLYLFVRVQQRLVKM
jgi:hypothetical protein